MSADLDIEVLKVRALLLVHEVEQRDGNAGKLDGLTKLAKLDFLCRYSQHASAVGSLLGIEEQANEYEELHAASGQAAPMVRYKFGPWDDRYYEVIGALVGRGLMTYNKGRRGSVGLSTTSAGREICERLMTDAVWSPVRRQCQAVADLFGGYSGNQLRQAIYDALPDEMDTPHRTALR